jgi:hypothetical protein
MIRDTKYSVIVESSGLDALIYLMKSSKFSTIYALQNYTQTKTYYKTTKNQIK